jgi:hypothetical protein
MQDDMERFVNGMTQRGKCLSAAAAQSRCAKSHVWEDAWRIWITCPSQLELEPSRDGERRPSWRQLYGKTYAILDGGDVRRILRWDRTSAEGRSLELLHISHVPCYPLNARGRSAGVPKSNLLIQSKLLRFHSGLYG